MSEYEFDSDLEKRKVNNLDAGDRARLKLYGSYIKKEKLTKDEEKVFLDLTIWSLEKDLSADSLRFL